MRDRPAAPARSGDIGAVIESVVSIYLSMSEFSGSPFTGVEVTKSQLRALFILAHSEEPVTPTTIATVLAITPGAVTQLVDGLRAAGLVESTPNPDDARSRILVLTKTARTEVAQFEAAIVRAVEPRFRDLSSRDLARLAQLIGRVRL